MRILLSTLITTLTLIGCSQSSNDSKSDSAQTQNNTLQISQHPQDATRFSNSKTNGILCPQYMDYCYNYAEDALKVKYPQLIQNIGDGISIKLYDGTIKKYLPERDEKDHPDYCSICSYKVIQEYPVIDSVLILRAYYEGMDYILLNLKTGNETIIANPPVISPDYKYLLSINSDLEAGYTENELNIYAIDENHNLTLMVNALTPKFIKVPIEFNEFSIGIASAKWIGNARFIAEANYYENNHYNSEAYLASRSFEFELRSQNGGKPTWSAQPITHERAMELEEND